MQKDIRWNGSDIVDLHVCVGVCKLKTGYIHTVELVIPVWDYCKMKLQRKYLKKKTNMAFLLSSFAIKKMIDISLCLFFLWFFSSKEFYGSSACFRFCVLFSFQSIFQNERIVSVSSQNSITLNKCCVCACVCANDLCVSSRFLIFWCPKMSSTVNIEWYAYN